MHLKNLTFTNKICSAKTLKLKNIMDKGLIYYKQKFSNKI